MSDDEVALLANEIPINPVVLIHGWSDISFATDTLKWLQAVLRRHKIPSITVRILPFSSIELRSAQAIEQIRRAYPDREVHLWGHSMGGLNARHIAWLSTQEHGIGFKVKSVTMLATPNRGLRMFNFLDNLPSELFFVFLWQFLGIDLDGTRQLSEGYVTKQFNLKYPDVDGIKYISWSGHLGYSDYKSIFGIPWVTNYLIGAGTSDGGCPAVSSNWGRHIDTLMPTNHFTLLDTFVAEKSLQIMKAEDDGASEEEVDELVRKIREQANTPDRKAKRRETLIRSTFYELLLPIELMTGYPISSMLAGRGSTVA